MRPPGRELSVERSQGYDETTSAADAIAIRTVIEDLTSPQRSRLRACLDVLDPEHVGEVVAEPGQWPHVVYSNEANALWDAIHDAQLVVSFDWTAWVATVDATALPTDDPVDAVRTITTIIRGDRFNDGLLLVNLQSGVLTSAVESVLDS